MDGEVEGDFGAGPVMVHCGLQFLSRHDARLGLPADGPVDWSQREKATEADHDRVVR